MPLPCFKIRPLAAFLFLAFAALSACQQNSVQPTAPPPTPASAGPVLTVSSGDTVYQTLGFGFTPPAAFAYDSVDGDISANIIITHNVNANAIGTYWVHYFVMDSDSNTASDTVTVIVQNGANALAGTYLNCHDSCQVTGVYNYNASVTVSTTVNGAITINNFAAFGTGVNITATVSLNSINFPNNQTLGSGATLITAAGTIVNTVNGEFDVAFTWTDGTTSEVCYSHYRR